MSAQTSTVTSSPTPDVSIVRINASPLNRDPVILAARKRRVGTSLSIIVPIALLVYWQLGADNGWFDVRIFSSPRELVTSADHLVQSGALWDDLAATLRRVLVGYCIGALTGILLGTALGWSILARSAIRPIIAALQTVPVLGILPIFLMIFGLGELPIYLVTIVGMTVLVSLGTMDAVSSVPTSFIEAARSMHTPRIRFFTEVVMPAALGRIFTSLRIGVGLGVLSVVGMEFLIADQGIGRRIWTSWNLFLPADMFVAIIIASLMGVTLNALIGLAQRIVMPWQRDGDRVV